MIGDIVLIRDRSKLGDANIAGQRAITGDYDAPPYTHVALLVGTYKGVHAMPAPEHIGLTLTYELLSPEKEWAVWRHHGLSEKIKGDRKLWFKFAWDAESYVGERYNNPVLRKAKEHHSFCSELIGKVYGKAGIHFPGKPENLMPITIAKTVRHDSDWCEVTDEYRDALRADPRYQHLYDSTNLEKAKKAQEALLAAKESVNKSMAEIGEGMVGLNRFDRWSVETGKGGWQVWGLKDSVRGPELSNEAVEWSLLFAFDEVDDSLLDLFVKWTPPSRQ